VEGYDLPGDAEPSSTSNDGSSTNM
jgi:hypothetical protein